MTTVTAPPRRRAPSRPATRRSVRALDRLMTAVISGGGLIVIVAVLGILVFLVTVVVPLFGAAEARLDRTFTLPWSEAAPPLFCEVDEYLALGLALTPAGRLIGFDATDGTVLSERDLLPPGARLTSHRRAAASGSLALGLADGRLLAGRVGFAHRILEPGVEAGRRRGGDGSIRERTAAGPVRETALLVELGLPLDVGSGAVVACDAHEGPAGGAAVALTASGDLRLFTIALRKSPLGRTQRKETSYRLPFEPRGTAPARALLTTRADRLVLVWPDGHAVRYDLHDPAAPAVAEVLDLVTEEGVLVTEACHLLGERSFVIADDRGRVVNWFVVARPGSAHSDGRALVPARVLASHGAPVTRATPSPRGKGLLTADEAGTIRLHHATNARHLLDVAMPSGLAVAGLQFAPKADAVFAVDRKGGATLWRLHNPHPEMSLRSLFGKVWYEDDPEPTWTWQSGGGTDDYEEKQSLVPLIFGTLKATFYSMFFALPIALLAALYTSEFLDRRLRVPLKSTVELMASLPSVVLGFLAALVLAPFVERGAVTVMAGLAFAPLACLAAGYLAQFLPVRLSVRLSRWPQLGLAALLIALGFFAAGLAAGPLERAVFAGDFKQWLDGRVGTGAPLVAFLAWPAFALALWLGARVLVRNWMERHAGSPIRLSPSALELTRFVVVIGLATLLAAALGKATAAAGVDLRESLVGTWVQRNSLLVGFVMGFAVIPLIYTLSEDALSSVPEHLRAGSLACGATPWQTALRVVFPLAFPGIFSAVMIGLGRAVGETMIVVMAAGNTPILDVNPFNGFRALSANVAVEMPEAVRDSTLYRILFLAGLTLFVMTFVVNTAAEVVRQRFRRRARRL